MLQNYTVVKGADVKIAPKKNVLQAILNYSKSLEVKEIENKKVLINLN